MTIETIVFLIVTVGVPTAIALVAMVCDTVSLIREAKILR